MSGKRMSAAAAAIAALNVGSCNSTFFDTFDVESGKSRVLLADQRVVITKTIVETISGKPGTPPGTPQEKRTVRIVCAEPSPDAVTVFGASIAASGGMSGSEQVSLGGGYQEAAASIGLRTAAITLIRDIAYRACEARMNGAFGEGEYEKILGGMPAVVVGVFAIDGLTQMRAAPAVVVNAALPTTTASAGGKPAAGEKPAASEKPAAGDKPATGDKPTAGAEAGQPATTSSRDVKAQDTQYIKDGSKEVVNIVRLVLISVESDAKRREELRGLQ